MKIITTKPVAQRVARDRNKRAETIKYAAQLLKYNHSTSITTVRLSRAARVTQPLLHYHWPGKNCMSQIFKDAYKYLEETDELGAQRVKKRESLCESSLIKEWICSEQ